MPKFWVKVGEKVGGPFTFEKLQQLTTQGKLKSAHLVSTDRKKWEAANSISELSFPKGNSPSDKQGATKRNKKSARPPSSKLPASWLKSATKRGGAQHQPASDEKAPTVSEGEDSFLQVLKADGEAETTSVREIREDLLQGKLTRHHQTRWIEPRPKKSDYKDESDPDDEVAKEAYREAVTDWKLRRAWRPIGEGLVNDSLRIGLLYRPAKSSMKIGIFVIGGLFAVAALVLEIAGIFQMLRDQDAIDRIFESEITVVAITLLAFTAVVPALRPVFFTATGTLVAFPVLIGAIGGLIIGAPAGWLTGICIGSLLPKPPPDEYVEQA